MPLQSNFLELIPERKKLLGTSIQDLLENLMQFENNTLILLDIETLGLNPSFEYEQITELAAAALKNDDLSVIDKINFKVKLSKSALELLTETESIQRFSWERRQKRRGKTAILDPNEIIEMTKYTKINAPEETERNAILKFYEFVDKYKNPVVVAHNADFDVKYLLTRSKLYDLKFPTVSVLDTLKISQFFFVPTLQTLKNKKDVEKLANSLMRNSQNHHISSRLGDLAEAFGVNADGWHTASSDVEMTRCVLIEMIKFFKKYQFTDISRKQEEAIRKTLRKGIRLRPKK